MGQLTRDKTWAGTNSCLVELTHETAVEGARSDPSDTGDELCAQTRLIELASGQLTGELLPPIAPVLAGVNSL